LGLHLSLLVNVLLVVLGVLVVGLDLDGEVQFISFMNTDGFMYSREISNPLE
jgi:hypothetical protein